MSHQLRIRLRRARCPYCHIDVEPGDAKAGCDSCQAWHHRECFLEHGRCSACNQVPTAPPPDARPWCAWPGGCASPASEDIYEILDERFCFAHGRREVLKTVRFALPYGVVVCLVAASCTYAYAFEGRQTWLLILAVAFWLFGLGLSRSALSGYLQVRRRRLD